MTKLRIKDIKEFRTYFKNEAKERREFHIQNEEEKVFDENFIGVLYNDKKGLFYMFNSDKDPKNFLQSVIKNADSNQIIYELLQNAYDSSSSQFDLYYNNKYLMAINDGKPFTYEGVRSILNIGDSTKTDDENSIGKFGIGFKLIYQLIKSETDVTPVIKENIGPIIYSWYEGTNAINKLLQSNDIEPLHQEYREIPEIIPTKRKKHEIVPDHSNSNAPWLFKIRLTCFPAQPGDKEIKGSDYINQEEVFPLSELEELKEFIKKLPAKEIQNLNSTHGSILFLKLKKDFSLIERSSNLQNGLPITLKIFEEYDKDRKIEKVNIGEPQKPETHEKNSNLIFETFFLDEENTYFREITKSEAITKPHIFFGYLPDYKNVEEQIRPFSNYYLFFPIAKEIHEFNFVIQSNAFSIATSRINLETEQNNTNKYVFLQLAELLEKKLDNYIQTKDKNFFSIFLSIVLTKHPKKEAEKDFLESFYEPMIEYFSKNIPIKQSESNPYPFVGSKNEVVIKNCSLNIESPDLFECKNHFWFNWDIDDELIFKEATEKLKLNHWTIADLINNSGDNESIYNWIKNTSSHKEFCKELNRFISQCDDKRLKEIRFLKLGSEILSISDINKDPSKYFLFNNKSNPLKESNILSKIGFTCSDLNFEEYDLLYSFLKEHVSEDYLKEGDPKFLLEKISRKAKLLEVEKNDYSNFIMELFSATYNHIDESIVNEPIFYNSHFKKLSISELISNTNDYPIWLSDFIIHEEFTLNDDLQEHLISKNYIYKKIIQKIENWGILQNRIEQLLPEKHIEITNVYDYINNQLFTLDDDKISGKTNYSYIPYVADNTIKLKKSSEILYHEKINSVNLKSTIEELTGKIVFHLPANQYLKPKESAFHTENVDLEKLELYEVELKKNRLVEFLDFCSESNWPVFNRIYITEDLQDNYKINKKSNYVAGKTNREIEPVQCILFKEDTNLKSVSEYFKGKIEILNFYLKNPAPTKIAFRNIKDLFILKLNSDFPLECFHTFIDIVDSWSDVNLKKDFLEKYPKIELKSSISLTGSKEDDPNFKIIKLATGTFQKSELTDRALLINFKRKIFINNVSINSVKFYPPVSILGTNFTNISYTDILRVLENEIANLTKVNTNFNDEEITNRIFKPDEKQGIEDILNVLEENYKEKELDYLQISFVLLVNPEKLSVFNLSNIIKLELIKYFYDKGFLKENYEPSEGFIEYFQLKIKLTELTFSEREKLDSDILEWINSESNEKEAKLHFLSKFGVISSISNKGNNIINMRKFLTQFNSDNPKEFELDEHYKTSSLNKQHIIDTFIKIHESKFEFKQIEDEQKLKLIHKLFQELEDYEYIKSSNVPILYISNVDVNNKRTYGLITNFSNKELLFGLSPFQNHQHKIFGKKNENQIFLEKTLLNPGWLIFEEETNKITLIEKIKTEDLTNLNEKKDSNLHGILKPFLTETKHKEKPDIKIFITEHPLQYIDTFNGIEIRPAKSENSTVSFYSKKDRELYININSNQWLDKIENEEISKILKDLLILEEIKVYIKEDSSQPKNLPANKEYIPKYLFPNLIGAEISISEKIEYVEKLIFYSGSIEYILSLLPDLKTYSVQKKGETEPFYGLDIINDEYKSDVYKILTENSCQIIPISLHTLFNKTATREIKSIEQHLDESEQIINSYKSWKFNHLIANSSKKVYLSPGNPLVNDYFRFKNLHKLSDTSHPSNRNYLSNSEGNIICFNENNFKSDFSIRTLLETEFNLSSEYVNNLNEHLDTENLIGGNLGYTIKEALSQVEYGQGETPPKVFLDHLRDFILNFDINSAEPTPTTGGPGGGGQTPGNDGNFYVNIGHKGERAIFESIRIKENEPGYDITWFNRKYVEPQYSGTGAHGTEECDIIFEKNNKKIHIESKASIHPFSTWATISLSIPEWNLMIDCYKNKQPYILIRVTDLEDDDYNNMEHIRYANLYIVPDLFVFISRGFIKPVCSKGKLEHQKIYLTFNTDNHIPYKRNILDFLEELTK